MFVRMQEEFATPCVVWRCMSSLACQDTLLLASLLVSAPLLVSVFLFLTSDHPAPIVMTAEELTLLARFGAGIPTGISVPFNHVTVHFGILHCVLEQPENTSLMNSQKVATKLEALPKLIQTEKDATCNLYRNTARW